MPKIKALTEHSDAYRQCLRSRGLDDLLPRFDEALEVHRELAANRGRFQDLRSEIKKISEQFRTGKSDELAAKSRELGAQTKAVEEESRQLAERLERLELMLPNWFDDQVPVGKGDELEETVRFTGKPVVWTDHREEFDELYPGCEYDVTERQPFHHYGMVGSVVDQETGGKVAQSRFYYELDDLVVLDMALTMYALEFFRKSGFADRMMIPPFMTRRSVEERTTYFEAFEDTIFEIEKDELTLVPSSEHSILAFYEDTLFNHDDLPIRVMAWSPCFRREAGSHGIDTRGIFRVKQFTKVELHSIVEKDRDVEEVEACAAAIEEFLATLGVPSRTVVVPSGDMDKRALLQLDVQSWMPAQGRFRETHSLATLGTWASEKLTIRYRDEDKRKQPTRHVYATAVAVQRMLCVLAENHYDAESHSIRIPEVLRPYSMGLTAVAL